MSGTAHTNTGHQGQPGAQQQPPTRYGAPITTRQYVRAVVAAGVGSVLEWYDYTVFVALNPVLTQVFFASGQDPKLKQLSFWSVYAVGYICRPLGSLLFGHICDVQGRRYSLMLTLLLMAIPTVLIGCLPTYAQGGAAAPILLSLLRLVQGIAVGGELGTAVVFLFEISPHGAKTRGGSVVFLGVTCGILMGIIAAMIVNAAIPPAALVDWGWRLPFLFGALTLAAGVALRSGLPESFEFEQDRVKAAHRAKMERLRTLSTSRRASSLKQRSRSISRGGDGGGGAADGVQAAPPSRQHTTAAAAAAAASNGSNSSRSKASEDVACVVDGGGAAPQQLGLGQVQEAQQQPLLAASPAACCPLWTFWGHEPVRLLFARHWREVLLLFWFETWSAANFYAFYAWLPAHMATTWGVPTNLTLGMTLANMSLTLPLIAASAHLADRGLQRLGASAAVLALAAATSAPMLLAIRTRSVAAAWLMQLADLFLNACIFGWLPSVGSLLFPVNCRASGYNFAHTAAQSWLGGLTPVIISALQVATRSIYLVVGLYLTAAALISLGALALLWRAFPETNRGETAVGAAAAGAASVAAAAAAPAVPATGSGSVAINDPSDGAAAAAQCRAADAAAASDKV